MVDYTLTTLSYRGLAFGRGTPRLLKRGGGIVGWEELPPGATAKADRYGGHGFAPAAIHHDGRTVIMSGFVQAADDRDALVQEFRRVMVPNLDPWALDTLTVTMAGMTLTAFVQLTDASIDMTDNWGSGWFEFKAKWEAPDPRRFQENWSTVTLPITPPSGGLTFPITFPITFPAQPPQGAAAVYNPGTAPAPAIYELNGPIQRPGVAVVPAGRRLQYDFNLTTDQRLRIDTSAPGAELDGGRVSATANSDLTVELEIPPGEFTVQALGAFTTGTPTLTVTYLPAYW